MECKFWGTRGSIAAPGKDTIVYGGNTTCLEITLETGRKLVIDAGTGIRPLGEHLLAQEEKVEILLLLTHIHWDHVLGFLFFDPIFESDAKISVDGCPACMKGLTSIFATKRGDGNFPVKFEDLTAEIQYLDTVRQGPMNVDGVIVDTIPLHHPQGGLGFRFREGEKTLVFITDNELTEDAWKGRQPDDYAEFCRDADILIHDAQFTPEEIDKYRGWGHSDYRATLELAQKAHVKKLILFHHDPSRTDQGMASIEATCKDLVLSNTSQIEVVAAREGTQFSL